MNGSGSKSCKETKESCELNCPGCNPILDWMFLLAVAAILIPAVYGIYILMNL
jgi:hypothetical protein